jgi:hypothetical protein
MTVVHLCLCHIKRRSYLQTVIIISMQITLMIVIALSSGNNISEIVLVISRRTSVYKPGVVKKDRFMY